MAKQVYSREFKLAVVQRVAAGERVSALALELGVKSRRIYLWLNRYRIGGAAALRPDGRPTRAEAAVMHLGAVAPPPAVEGMPPPAPPDELELARIRIAELERKVGRQELELDFFQKALRHVREARRSSGEPGGSRSSKSSGR
jgi:transposase-like protein